MPEVHLFPSHGYATDIRRAAASCFRLEPAQADRFMRDATERRAARVREVGGTEAAVAGHVTHFRRATENEVGRLRVEAVIADPEELQVARKMFADFYAAMTS